MQKAGEPGRNQALKELISKRMMMKLKELFKKNRRKYKEPEVEKP